MMRYRPDSLNLLSRRRQTLPSRNEKVGVLVIEYSGSLDKEFRNLLHCAGLARRLDRQLRYAGSAEMGVMSPGPAAGDPQSK